MVRYAAGFEGLEISCSAIALPEPSCAAAAAAALARTGSAGSSVLLGSCRSMQHNPLDSDADPGTASAGFSDEEEEEVTEFLYEPLGTDTDEGVGCAPGPAAVGYKLMRSTSSQHTSEDDLESPVGSHHGQHQQQAERGWRSRQQLSCEHSQEDVISEVAHLLPAARCNGSGNTIAGRGRVRVAWASSGTDGVLDSRSGSDDGSDSDSGRDVRLRHAYGRRAAGSSSTNGSWQLGASKQQATGRHVQQVDSAAQTSPLHGGSHRLNQLPGSSWTTGGKQVTSFSSTMSHTAVEDISTGHNSSSSGVGAPAAGAAAAAAAKKYMGSGSSTMLGPGTHRIGRGGQLPPIGSGLEAVTCSVTDTATVLHKCSLQTSRLPAKLPGAVADSTCDSDSEPPALAARLAQKQQQQHQKLVAAHALAGSAGHSRTSSSGGSSAAGSALAAATATAAAAKATKKKKKGKAKADAAAARAAAEARAAVEARRHDRDTVECALLDNRGSSSRGDSEVC
jgi:hypothetical protein